MKNILSALTLLISASLSGQHYYNDIIGTREISNKMKAFVAAKVQSVTATGYDQRGVKTTDFNEWQEVQANGSVLKITTRNGQSATRLYHEFDDKTRLIRSRDSAADIQIITAYTYDAKDNLSRILVTTSDALKDFNETEDRQWLYTSAGKPEKMIRILNGKDTTEYRFTLNEDGNVADETLYRKFGSGEDPTYYIYENQRVYYYYDDQERLSDIVRYNKKAKQMLPDIMFEYDESNRVIQRLTTVSGTARDYFIWRYVFNEKGVKTREALFNKFKELKGRIEYTYSFAP